MIFKGPEILETPRAEAKAGVRATGGAKVAHGARERIE